MKKILALILVLSICLTSFITAYATNDNDYAFTQTELNKISRILYDSYNFNVFDISNYSLSSLRLASPINSYTYLEDDLVVSTNKYIPVYNNNDICGVVISFVNDDNEINYTYNESYSSELNNFVSENNSLAIVGVEDGLLAISEDDYTVLSGTVTNSEVNALTQNSESIAYSEVVQYSSLELNMAYPRSSSTVLSVSKCKQVQDYDCWIACVRCLGQFKNAAVLLTQQNLITRANSLFGWPASSDNPGTINQTRDLLRNVYNVSSVAHTGSISMTSVTSNINNNKPVAIGFTASSGGTGHMVVFNGYSSSSQNFAFVYMDPDDGAFHSVNTTSTVHITINNTTYYVRDYLTL